MIYYYQCENCGEMNTFEAPAADYVDSRTETCKHCGHEQEIEGFVDGELLDGQEEKSFDDWFTGGHGYQSDAINYEGDEV